MDLTFFHIKRDKKLLHTPYELLNCFEAFEDDYNNLIVESIDFKYGLQVIDFLKNNLWNPDIRLPLEATFTEKDFFFYNVRFISRQFMPNYDKIKVLLHNAESIYKVVKHVNLIVNDNNLKSEISFSIDSDLLNNIEKLYQLTKKANEKDNLIACYQFA